MQLLGTIAGCEINSIATQPSGGSCCAASLATAGSDGHVRFWDVRLPTSGGKRRDVLACAVPNPSGDKDLLEVIWGPSAAAAVVGNAAASATSTSSSHVVYTIAGSTLSCVDVRTATVLAQCSYGNTYKVQRKGAPAGTYDARIVPADLASFDAFHKQHPLCGAMNRNGHYGNGNANVFGGAAAFTMCDDNGEVYVVDPSTCLPMNAAGPNANHAASYNGVLRPSPASKTVSCGYASFNLGTPSIAAVGVKRDGDATGKGVSSALEQSTLVCGMDNNVHLYRTPPTVLSSSTSSPSSPLYATLRTAKRATTISMEGLGGEDADLGSAAAKAGNQQQRRIANPPIPSCYAPLFVDDMPLVAIGRGDGSFVVVDVAPKMDVEELAASDEGKDQPAKSSAFANSEIAYVGQGHAHNTIGTCLWVPPSVVSSSNLLGGSGAGGGSAVVEEYQSAAPKVLITIPTSGEVTMWDLSKVVMPMGEEEEGGEEQEDAGEATPLFATNVRGKGLAGPKSMMNCAALTSCGRGLLVGTSGGELLMEMFA